MANIQRPRGTRDFGPEEMGKRRHIEGMLRKTAENFGFREIVTPTFEHSELFTERSGEEIKSEMYMFKDKGGRELALRPELTAPTMRFYANELRHMPKPIKVYYFGNCFRYERPQAGRFREFWQLGAEIVGGGEHEGDAEIIALAAGCLENSKLEGFVTRIGHLGVLRAVLSEMGIAGEKQSNCMQLIDKQDMEGLYEILDVYASSSEEMETIKVLLSMGKTQEISDEITEVLSGNPEAENSLNNLNRTLGTLRSLGVEDYQIDLGIARGLDYYTGMVFEIDYPLLGAEKQVCGGGAYALADLFGAEQINSTGFAIGFDRVMTALDKQGVEIPLLEITAYVIPLGKEANDSAFKIAAALRKNNISCDCALMERSIAKHMKYANAICARYAIIIGEEELKSKEASVKDMESGEQIKMPFEKIVEHIKNAKAI